MSLRCQSSDLLSVGPLVAVSDQADDGRVVSELYDDVGASSGHTVVRQQGAQERAEHAALGDVDVEGQGGECGGAYPRCQGSACQKAQDPVTEGGVEY